MSARLTIAHVTAYYMPGLGYQENHLPFCQASLGHRVHLVTGDRYVPHPNYDTVYQPRLGPRLVGPGQQSQGGVTIHRLPVAYENRRRQNPLLSGLRGTLAGIAPDIIHVHGVNTLLGLQMLLSGLHRDSTLVFDHHVCAFNLSPFTALKRAYYALFRLLVLPPLKGRVKAWLPINDDARQVLADQLGISGSRVHVNGLGIDCGAFRRDAARGAAWRQANGIPPEAVMVVHAGKLEPRKNVHVLVEAFRRAPAGFALVLVGGGPPDYLAALRQAADDRVRFLPMLPNDQLPALYNAADLGVWPGDDSVTILEARGCGLPLALSAASCWAAAAGEPWRWLVGRGNVAELAAVLEGFRSPGEAERRELAVGAEAALSWRAVAEASLAIYRDALGEGR